MKPLTLESILESLRAQAAPVVCREMNCAHVFDVGLIGECPECGSRYVRLATQEDLEEAQRREDGGT